MVKTLQYRLVEVVLTPWFHWTSAVIFLVVGSLVGCGGHVYHIVEPGETLYSISWMYGHDYRTVAKWNGITSPYIIHKGQRLQVAPLSNDDIKQQNNKPAHAAARAAPPVKRKARKSVTASAGQAKGVSAPADKPIDNNVQSLQKSRKYSSHSKQDLVWSWPVKQGKIVQSFVASNPGKRGIDVAGKQGQTIYSASHGVVVYSGQGLPSYGKLIIIKHNEMFLSAYAHNKKLLVKEGDSIRVGQPIALMGKTGSNHTKLHFEIRRDGKPVDPLQFLPARPPH